MSSRRREPSPQVGVPDAPKEIAEFLQKDWTHLESLSLSGWYKEISDLCRFSVDNELGFFEGDPNVILTCDVGQPGEQGRTNLGQVGVRLVRYIPADDGGHWLYPFQLPALIVNLNAPDEVIIQGVIEALKEMRERPGSPVPKSGNKAANSYFDERTFTKWRRYKIQTVAELLAWRSKLDPKTPRPPDYWLSDWIGFAEPRDFNEAVNTLRGAIKSLPYLMAQLAYECPSPRR